MVTSRRQLTPAQRSAKIERDRRRRRERNVRISAIQKFPPMFRFFLS